MKQKQVRWDELQQMIVDHDLGHIQVWEVVDNNDGTYTVHYTEGG